MRRLVAIVFALVLVSCDQLPSATPKGPTGALGEIAARAAALAQTDLTDARFESFLSDLDLKGTYGARADVILGQLERTRTAVIGQRRSSSATGGARLASLVASLGVFIVPEFADTLAKSLDEFTRKSGTLNLAGRPYSSTDEDENTTTTTNLNIADTISSAGARVTLTMHWTLFTITKDKKSGAVLAQINDNRTMVGAITVCPDAQGAAAASLDVGAQYTGIKNGVVTTRSGTSSTGFTGRVDDSANLKTVEQTTQDKQSWENTSGSGDYDANLAATWSFQGSSNVMGNLDQSSFKGGFNTNGDGASKTKESAWTFTLDAYALTDAYKEAQRLWRNGRCVMVTAPDYKAETPIAVAEQEKSQHDEKVDISSETKFSVNLKHRFGGGAISAATTTSLSGDKTITPSRVDGGSGALTYKAPDEDDKKATLQLKTTSKRGIGTLVLDFHTGAQALTLSLTGTLQGQQGGFATSDLSYSVSIGPIEFKKVAENTWFGMGPWTATVATDLGVGGTSQSCKGTEAGTASMVAMVQTRGDRKVFVINRSQSAAAGTGTVECVSITPIGTFPSGSSPSNGASAGTFMGTLDDIVIPAEGGTIAVAGDRADATGGLMHATGTVVATTAKK